MEAILISSHAEVGNRRDAGFRKDLKAFLAKAGIEYKSPHKFRHSHIRFLKDRSYDFRDLETIANNSMQTVATMFKYGQLGEEDSLDKISRLCSRSPKKDRFSNSPDPATVLWVINHLARTQEEIS
jgi:hypothetical protein